MPSIESIVFEGVGFGYEGAPRLFSDLSIKLPLHCNVLVTGPAGNGQSTFLKLLVALLQPQEGRVLMNGLDTTGMSFEEFQPLRSRIGYTFDFGGLFANRTLLDNLTLPLLYHGLLSHEAAEQAASRIAERFGFVGVLGLRPASVSGGLRKTVCILRSLLLKPELLVMDDPFTGLDGRSAQELVNLLGELREAGVIRHLYLTSREEVWVSRLGAQPLVIERGGARFAGDEVFLNVSGKSE